MLTLEARNELEGEKSSGWSEKRRRVASSEEYGGGRGASWAGQGRIGGGVYRGG